MALAVASALLVGALVHPVAGIYLPGVAPVDYEADQELNIKVDKMSSVNTALGYDYYSVKICEPRDGVHDAAENLGEYLTGENIQNSPYNVNVLQDSLCNVVCRATLEAGDQALYGLRIKEDYWVNWILDNLPAAYLGTDTTWYSLGFPLGYAFTEADAATGGVPGDVMLFNHHNITVEYHATDDGFRIVGFEVVVHSVQHEYSGDWSDDAPPSLQTCIPGLGLQSFDGPMFVSGESAPKDSDGNVEVIWTYDVKWIPSNVRWASRWDVYLSMGNLYDDQVHWFALVNALVIVLFLSGMVAMILVRALYKDLSRYNRVATDEEKAEDREDTGWKLVHADVFRPPARKQGFFVVLVGISTQVFGMACFTLMFAAIGFLSPANRGSLMLALLLLFLVCGSIAGYSQARTLKMFTPAPRAGAAAAGGGAAAAAGSDAATSGVSWQRSTLWTAVGFPAFIFSIIFFLNLFVWAEGSSNAIPFGSMFAVLTLWLLLSIPLVFLGAFVGFKRPKIEFPVATGTVPRPVPAQPWYLSRVFVMLIGGVLPFGAIFVELYFILTSLWLSQYYYVFGFLALAFIILIITCAEIAIVLTYFQLCAEDYHWWWRSFLIPGASGLYVYLYSLMYMATRLSLDGISVLLYMGYMFLISLMFSMMTGVAGHIATFVFVKKIYASVKVD